MIRTLALIATTTAFASLSQATFVAAESHSNGLSLATVNYPLAYFAERIGGDLVDARYLGPVDEDPAFWSPSTEDVVSFQSSDIIVRNGADYAKWAAKTSLPRSRTVTTVQAEDRRLIKTDGPVHSHGDGDEHSHGGTAFTTWLDFSFANAQAEAIASYLRRKDRDNAAEYQAGLGALSADLLTLDAQAAAVGEALKGQTLLASHPIYQYLGAAYDIEIESLTWEPDLTPDEAGWNDYAALKAKTGATIMLWEGEPSAETRQRLEADGVTVVLFSQQPAGPDGESDDLLENFSASLNSLLSAAGGS